MIKVNCFAHLKELAGGNMIQIDRKEMSVKELLEEVQRQYHIQSDSVLVAINEEYALPDDQVTEHDTVALIPPVSGG
ncbi:MoaD/ThiS family protein [Jeotgalibacillus haloalkalitolerans]|uniref:Molybdopterin synthase sulfur carrier subunit n=1 Tax=Jeotgalibacillus haloalkalitolerans TaxID=3104292 RepID=A0ABU5KPX1_9BACL|nr:MoaD/ThiS family protein [Jeotgalibacillus sp. HH7-29]MDZ5713303.1 MoaD/ThiS family protein [Jeotgalibacillus sp. HH7-29]